MEWNNYSKKSHKVVGYNYYIIFLQAGDNPED